MSTVDKEGESLAPRGIFAEIAGLQQKIVAYTLVYSVSSKEYYDTDHQRGSW